MKNQYFGDLNDYRKYSLLRHLSGLGELGTTVCWVLTEDDSRSDGSRVEYLQRRDQWGAYDPPLFEHLRRQVVDCSARRVAAIQSTKLMPNVRFFDDKLEDDCESRDSYFDRFFRFAAGSDLVFFDPDNGIGVKSVPRGARRSSKYVYDSEIAAAYRSGHSILIYQHFPRRPRQAFLQTVACEFRNLPGIGHVVSFTTSYVAFLLLPQKRHQRTLLRNARKVLRMWNGQIGLVSHCLRATACQDRWERVDVPLGIAS